MLNSKIRRDEDDLIESGIGFFFFFFLRKDGKHGDG